MADLKFTKVLNSVAYAQTAQGTRFEYNVSRDNNTGEWLAACRRPGGNQLYYIHATAGSRDEAMQACQTHENKHAAEASRENNH